MLQLGRPAEAYDLLAPHLKVHERDSEAWWLAAKCRAAGPNGDPEEVSELLGRACRTKPALRAAIADDPAFTPYLDNPSISALVVPASKDS
jgi:hypothetical protein